MRVVSALWSLLLAAAATEEIVFRLELPLNLSKTPRDGNFSPRTIRRVANTHKRTPLVDGADADESCQYLRWRSTGVSDTTSTMMKAFGVLWTAQCIEIGIVVAVNSLLLIGGVAIGHNAMRFMAIFMQMRTKLSKVSSSDFIQMYRHIYKYIQNTIGFERGNNFFIF